MHDLDPAEQARRKDITQADVAQEALDKMEELEAEGRSPSEAFTEHGYSLSHVLKPAIAERQRIARELRVKPSAEVASDILDVATVQTKYAIAEYVAPEPVVVEEPVIEEVPEKVVSE